MVMYFSLNKKHIIIRTLVKFKNEKNEDLVRHSQCIRKVQIFGWICTCLDSTADIGHIYQMNGTNEQAFIPDNIVFSYTKKRTK